ncbi:MAG: hypothetical protein ACFFDF_21240 [Candidatus Odinarchaeota archaeon]
MNADKNYKIEMVKPLIFRLHFKESKEVFEIINFITDWHCKCPIHINTNKECSHIKLVKSWLGLNQKNENTENIVEKRFNAIMFKLLELETKFDTFSEKKKERFVVRGKTWDDAETRLFIRNSKYNQRNFYNLKKYFTKKNIMFKDLTEDDLVEYGHIKDNLADLTINTHRIFCRIFCKAMYPDIFIKNLYEFFPTIKHPHKKKSPPLPSDEAIKKIKRKLQRLNLDNEDDLLLFVEIALPFEICDRRALYSDLKKESFHLDTIDNSYVRYNYGKYKQDNAKAIKSPKLLEALKRLFKKFPIEHFPYLFTNKRTGEKIDEQSLTRTFKKFCGFNTHAVRYKYATKLYKNGYSSKQIAEMLGIQEQTLIHYIQEKQIIQIQDTREIPNLVLI